MQITEEELEQLVERLVGHLQESGHEEAAARISLPLELPPEEPPETAEGPAALAPYIDHTQLKPDTTPDQIHALCEEAREHLFASVCVNPTYVALAQGYLTGSDVAVCTVIGFPIGASTTATKTAEVRDAIANGAQELDMVLPIGRLKAGEYAHVYDDIQAVAATAEGRTVKVILETCLLTDEEKASACLLIRAAGAHFVKTSTGFSKAGATEDDIRLMRRVTGPDFGVKASGGIRDTPTARAMLDAGATRLGCSASVAIVTGGSGQGSY